MAGERKVLETLDIYKGSTREPLSFIVGDGSNGLELSTYTVEILMLSNEGTEAAPEYNATPTIAQTSTNVTVQPEVAFTVDATNNWILCPAHGVPNGWKVRFVGGSLPSGLNATDNFFARDIYTDRFKVATYEGGDAVDIGTGSGDFYIVGHVQYAWQTADVDTAGLFAVWFVIDDGTDTEREPSDEFGIVVSINETTNA